MFYFVGDVMAGKSKAPVKFPKVNQIARMQGDAIFDVGIRKADPLNSGKIKMAGGKASLRQNGGWVVSKATGKKRHERVCVTSEKSPEVMTCTVKGINPITGKKGSCKVILGVRSTYPDELKEQIEADELASTQRKREEGTTRIHTKRKRKNKVRKGSVVR